jgi:hypothetical protein
MYYDGSIASRLRELQREADAAYARVNYIQNQLGFACDKIRELEDENLKLKSILYTDSFYNRESKVEVPLDSDFGIDESPDNLEDTDKPLSNNFGKSKKTKK